MSSSQSVAILPCKVLACPPPARKCRINLCLPGLLSIVCMYAFKLVHLPGDPIIVFPNSYIVYDAVNYTPLIRG